MHALPTKPIKKRSKTINPFKYKHLAHFNQITKYWQPQPNKPFQSQGRESLAGGGFAGFENDGLENELIENQMKGVSAFKIARQIFNGLQNQQKMGKWFQHRTPAIQPGSAL